MKRRDFLIAACASSVSGSMLSTPVFGAKSLGDGVIKWTLDPVSNQYTSVSCDGQSLMHPSDGSPLISAGVRLFEKADQEEAEQPSLLGQDGLVRFHHRRHLHQSASETQPNVLEVSLEIQNTSAEVQSVEVSFVTSVSPDPSTRHQHLYLPLNVAGFAHDKRFASLGMSEFLGDCNVELDGQDFDCHYLEPMASFPNERQTKALLLVPVVDISAASSSWHVGLFSASDSPMRFRSTVGSDGRRTWTAGRVIELAPGQSITESCWLVLHQGDASKAWKAFHEFGHEEEFEPIDWTRQFKVHYYDFLSSAEGKDGVRGDGYDADSKHFAEFHVGMATQHGYYPHLGDFIRPDRTTWNAMPGSKQGPASMSTEIMRRRIKDTRDAGAKAAIYMHLTLIDDASELFPRFAEGRRVGTDGKPMRFPWTGPDVEGQCWWMSIAYKPWRDHLLQQARWMMEILDPDAICVDETFAGIGYDEAADRYGSLSSYAIEFFRDLRALVRSFGNDKAVFTSDCSRSAFCLWADGDVGDHAYGTSLGNPLYSQAPVRYLAALGDKAWRPCAWHFRHMWEPQMKLARQVGAGIGVSNGWIEYDGLHALPETERARMIRDIESILD